MRSLASQWRDAQPLVRAEIVANSWEIFSALLFVSAVVPQAFSTPWPSIIFAIGLAVSSWLARPLTDRGTRGAGLAAALRMVFWLLAVVPLLQAVDPRLLVATFGFGLMAGGIRRALYGRWLEPLPKRPGRKRLRERLRIQLSENAMVAGIVGGHVLLLFSVGFLRTQSKVVFRAWWEIIPVLALLGTLGFTLAVRPITRSVLAALKVGPNAEREAMLNALKDAVAIPRRLSLINLSVWLACIGVGVFYFQPGLTEWRWADAAMQLAFGSLFAWGVSFFQRGWHEDTVQPIVKRLREWTGTAAEIKAVSLRQRMLTEFGLPLVFTLTLSLFASIGLYRALGPDLPLAEDFAAITALGASVGMLVLAVGSVFMRAARQLSQPLSTLASAADRVASGKLDAEVPRVLGPVEVMGLGHSIEDMRKALARTIEELKQERASLESNVELRTAELRRALEELKQAQTALIQGERMALIGELVASVAHEIYNPLNAISGSVSALDRVSSELDQMLKAYQRSEELLPADVRQALAQQRQELDVAGALDDLTGVAKVVRSATRRSVEILGNLRSFSRASAEPIPTDLHGGLAETLSLLQHKLKIRNIRVVERYGELPQVTCRAGEVNQVFMNLLTNAIQAIESRHGSEGGVIEVDTSCDGEIATIGISDNGDGVLSELREKVFDPFFTTKRKGEGTGLGLSISLEIVQRHGGSLAVEDTEGDADGARFVCQLPVAGPKRRPASSSGAQGRAS
jgi:two-component system NtrC family sensor kinase